jgi:hypothetical protein
MGWEVIATEDQYNSADKFTGVEPLATDERTGELSREQYDSQVQTVSWDSQPQKDLASPLEAKKVSYHFYISQSLTLTNSHNYLFSLK